MVDDFERDPRFDEQRRVARKLAIRAVHATPVITRAGEPLGVITVHFDTPRTPTAREKLVADMCARYAAEAIESFNHGQVLRESEQRLREADRRKDEFLATLAHELRNPLAPIRNSLQILRHRAEAAGTNDSVLDMMERQTNQLVRLVDDLLEVSRITRGKIELSVDRVDIASVLRSAIETSQPLLERARHELVVTFPVETIYVDADSVRLCQVFANLLNNAAKYTDPGGRISITCENSASQITVSVRDNGVGIPEEMLARVFDMFTQIDRTLGRSQGGLGIGLTLVKRLVELHQGKIEAHSAGLGTGCEFRVSLPIVGASHSAADETSKPGSAGPSPTASRILVVDDNCDAAESLRMLLQVYGVEVRTVHDGECALESMQSFTPNIVLLDIGMPGMDGHEVARRIRQVPEWRDVKLIALTGWGQPEDRRRSSESGFDHHLVKPVGLDELSNLLRTFEESKPSS